MINSVAVTPESSKRTIVLEQPKRAAYTPSVSLDSLVKTNAHSNDVAVKSDTLVPPHSEAPQTPPVSPHEPPIKTTEAKTFSLKEREPLEENVQHLGKKVLERVNIGWKNMAYLTSEQCQKSKIGRIASKLDIPFFLLGFIPFLHFFWLIQPSVVLFVLGAVLKKPIGHEYLPR